MYSALLASLTMLRDFSWVFSQLSEIRGISPISQKIIDSDTTLPRLVNILFVLSVLGLQMIYIWSNTEE
jgi:archaellum biogenesis protein FlaJ (TadC family)